MRNRSIYYYGLVFSILCIVFLATTVKALADRQPLFYFFMLIFVIGLLVGYFRYYVRVKRKEMADRNKWQKYGLLLLFIAIYAVIRYGVRELISNEVSGQDYGIVLAFFILGLFISYFGCYSFYLWKRNGV
ncbi:MULTISPECIES: hypothetical protein [unclassified Paenibacillus]|uniref:hypothetical protein n=1 Tax=unclassified Paenibacillus TaxID=185978 RepID=UPI001C1064D7|nr:MULTISPECIES: hypothetical protein [unclassified Paenibacillus]MBU5441184.1 hypothetical protein [Paenibacillus sp. MSJ-34]CAH0120491.1 hypothetical protein PAE9249_03010 [Paenibacillus sp. CECT 9249]